MSCSAVHALSLPPWSVASPVAPLPLATVAHVSTAHVHSFCLGRTPRDASISTNTSSVTKAEGLVESEQGREGRQTIYTHDRLHSRRHGKAGGPQAENTTTGMTTETRNGKQCKVDSASLRLHQSSYQPYCFPLQPVFAQITYASPPPPLFARLLINASIACPLPLLLTRTGWHMGPRCEMDGWAMVVLLCT